VIAHHRDLVARRENRCSLIFPALRMPVSAIFSAEAEFFSRTGIVFAWCAEISDGAVRKIANEVEKRDCFIENWMQRV